MVTGIESYGIFVSLDEYYSGLIHISEISDDYVRNINNYVKIGETIKVRVLEVDDDTFQLKLSIKNLDYRNTVKAVDGDCSIPFYSISVADAICLIGCLELCFAPSFSNFPQVCRMLCPLGDSFLPPFSYSS